MRSFARLVLGLTALGACADSDPPAAEPAVEIAEQAVTGQDGALTVSTPGTVLNRYAAVAADVAAGGNQVTVTSIADLDATSIGQGPIAAGDLIMIYQAQGAEIATNNNPNYGNVTALNDAGRYELATVASVAGNTLTVTVADCGGFRSAYTTDGRAQVVRIPQLASLTVTGAGSITGAPWDGTRGGIVALSVGGTATVNGAIDASALGFRGGAPDNAASVNGATTFRTNTAADAAEKGESIAGDAARYAADFQGRYGRGAPANGGGGGVAHNGGGGGGANGNNGSAYTGVGVMPGNVTGAAAWMLDPAYAANGNALTTSSGGGRGGYSFSGSDQNALAVPPGDPAWGGDSRREVGGRGGRPVPNDPAQRLFLGGGGGAGDGNNGAAGAGGRGGGLVFVVADRVDGTGAIRANGAAGAVSNGNPGDAPGGGGGGGTIVVRANTLTGVVAEADGGAGGDQTLAANLEAEGPGGGGGGGYIAVSGGAITRTVDGGAGGTTNRPVLAEFPRNGATDGADGDGNDAVATLRACFADLALTMTDTPDPVVPGDTVTYTVTATNAGSSTAANLTIVDTLPPGTTFVSATGTGWTCSVMGQTVTCTRPTLASGASAPLTIVATVTAASGTLTNTATISAATGDTSTANNTASTTTTVAAPANDPPVNTVPASATTPEDTTLALGSLAVADPDAGTGELRVTLTVTNGTLTLVPTGLVFSTGDGTNDTTMTFTGTLAEINAALDTLRFTPNANFVGAAVFTITTNDQGNSGSGGARQDTDSFQISVTPVNDAPNAVNDAVTVAEDSGATTINVLGNDTTAPDAGESLTITSVTQPTGGTVTIVNGQIRFTPAPNFNGPTTFTYTVSDGNGGTDTATVTVNVTPVNDAPTANNDMVTVAEGSGPTVVNVLANDSFAPDSGETLTVTAVTQPANGTVTLVGGVVRFQPAPGFSGMTTFTYTVSDGNGGTDTATVTVNVTDVNQPPNANNDTRSIPEDAGATALNPLMNDSTAPDVGETLTITSVTQPASGGTVTITGNGSGLSFTPAPNFFGMVTFTYTVSDGNGGTDTATITINVTPVNDPPTAVDDTALVAVDAGPTAIDVLANDTSAPDGAEPLMITAVTQPAAGGSVTITGNGTGVSFTPAPGFSGEVTFTYTVSDGNGGTDTATVTIVVGGDDSDGDGITDDDEEDLGTDPQDADTDDDGVADGAEPSYEDDTDGDGLINPLDPDSDNDGLYDGTELGQTQPNADTDTGAGTWIPDADPSTETDPLDADTDDGGVEDGAEDTNHDGEVDNGERDPNNPADDAGVVDTDGDGLPDAVEVALGSDPADADTDDDGVRDGDEPNYQDDTDGDGTLNVLDPDSDDDGLKDGTELGITTPDADTDVGAGNFTPDADPSTTTSPLDADTDDGGVSDGDEDADHDGQLDPGERDPNDPRDDENNVVKPDTDVDGFTDDVDNCVNDANPDQADADDDGRGDICDPDADGDGFADDIGVSGGGCSTGGGNAPGAAVLALAVVLGLRRRRRAVLVAAAVAGTPALASAQVVEGEARNFAVERFQLSTDREGLLNVEWAEARGDLAFDVGMWVGYANDPLVVYRGDGDGDRMRVGSLVQDRTGAGLAAAFSPTKWLALGFDVPLILQQDRSPGAEVAPMGVESLNSFGLGDLRLVPKLTLLRQDRAGIGLAIIPAVMLPTRSSDSDYFGDSGAGFAPELALSRRGAGWRFGINAGYRFRKRATMLNLVVDDELFASAGLGLRFGENGGPPVGLDFTVAGAVSGKEPLADFNQNYFEGLAGFNVRLVPTAIFFAAAGLGFQEGFGTPDWRTLAGLRFGAADEPVKIRDVVKVVTPPPPPPVEDKDTDGDRILDSVDMCVDEPGLAELKGCPANDGDKDGIADHLDKCAEQPEDVDQFEDTDGCPDLDNDKDTVVDTMDQCPREAGVVDNGGCPDKDRDEDTVVDRLDNCPDEKGDPANAGCAKKQLVKITDTSLEIIESVYFATNKAVILPRSFKLLDNVASVLAAHPAVKVEIQGHTDSQGNDAYNKKLSQRRADAVMAYLVKQGVPAERLRAMGYGEEQAIADNKTKDGRAQNRRVVFAIVGADGQIKTREQGAGEDTKEQ